ncbi:hypothetical protein chiPu_0014107 [Chiloscyllium punctatum]|uniref:Uncharacterized protein n=1 Tax=Chiloscyllium punctatum TaxID=137246 RepID=A0A401SZ11_CHIPU|nr:hypothetical protein [Chiloscyllium punctatum]
MADGCFSLRLDLCSDLSPVTEGECKRVTFSSLNQFQRCSKPTLGQPLQSADPKTADRGHRLQLPRAD